jgi:uncharacterized protein (DUF2267 family)
MEETMSATGLDVFDKTIQTTNIWLDEIMEDMGPDRQVAWHTLGAVLRTLRDRLPPDLAAHLGAQLPLLVRGSFYDQYEPAATPEKLRDLDPFLEQIHAAGKCPRRAADRLQCARETRREGTDGQGLAGLAAGYQASRYREAALLTYCPCGGTAGSPCGSSTVPGEGNVSDGAFDPEFCSPVR